MTPDGADPPDDKTRTATINRRKELVGALVQRGASANRTRAADLGYPYFPMGPLTLDAVIGRAVSRFAASCLFLARSALSPSAT